MSFAQLLCVAQVLKITDQAQYKPIAVFMCDGAVYQNSKPPIVQKLCKDLVNAEGPSGGVDNLQSFFMYLGRILDAYFPGCRTQEIALD